MSTGLRDTIKEISPTWLQTEQAEKFLYLCGVLHDMLVEKAQEAQLARMPTRCDPSALPLLGDDRQIIRGIGESDMGYGERLSRAFDSWRLAGLPMGVMAEVIAYLSTGPKMRHVSNTSVWDSFAAGADTTQPPEHVKASPANWDWDGDATLWWRVWAIIYSVGGYAWCGPAPRFGTPGVKIGDKSISIGLNIPATEVETIRGLIATWKAEHAWVRWIIISFDETLFDPAQPSGGSVNPDGNWGRWSRVVGGQAVPARAANARYCDGII